MWKKGQKTKLASLAEVDLPYLSNVLARKKQPMYPIAKRLWEASKKMRLGIAITDWLDVHNTSHKLFKTMER